MKDLWGSRSFACINPVMRLFISWILRIAKMDSLSGMLYAKIGDWDLRTSLHSLVETFQDVNKHQEDQLIINTPVTNLHL